MHDYPSAPRLVQSSELENPTAAERGSGVTYLQLSIGPLYSESEYGRASCAFT